MEVPPLLRLPLKGGVIGIGKRRSRRFCGSTGMPGLAPGARAVAALRLNSKMLKPVMRAFPDWKASMVSPERGKMNSLLSRAAGRERR